MNNLAETIEPAIKALKVMEDTVPDYSTIATMVRNTRRNLENALFEWIKQGDTIPITKEFELRCCECKQIQINEDEYYLHLRNVERYPEEDASISTTTPRQGYETGLHQLKTLLNEYTDSTINIP